MNSHDQTQIPDWFSALIRNGLTALYGLCLEGCPASDSTKTVGALWTRLLWEKSPHAWNRERDSRRIAAAFEAMALDLKRWPAPAVFFEHLPPRDVVRQKPGQQLPPDWGRERQAEALAGMLQQFEEMGYDRYGNRLGAPPSTAKTVANMEQLRALYGSGIDRKSAGAGGDW